MSKIWGIRFDDRKFNIGDEISASHRFENGIDTGEELSGTCVIRVSDETDFLDYLDGTLDADFGELDSYNEALAANYQGKHVYLVYIESSWGWEYGEDEHEIVMHGPEVVRKIR